jgi:ATP-dependent DNA helicase PIF1
MTPTKKQKLFLDLAGEGKNIFLSGKAGTGKSTIVLQLIEKLKSSGRRVAAVAPTGIAANNIGGATMHSLFSLPPFGVLDFDECNFVKSEKRRVLDLIDTIIIDEVSMLRPDHLDAINWTLLKNGCGSLLNKQVIFVGDMRQLPPVLSDNTRSVLMRTYDGDRMFDAKIYPQLNVIPVELDEVVRQSDTDFIEALNIIREGGKSEYFRKFVGTEPNGGVILAPYNETVNRYNIEGLAKLNTDRFEVHAKIEGEKKIKPEDFNLESRIEVKNGAHIMYLVNSKDAPLVNGTMGVFASYEGNHYIQVNGIDYPLNPVEFTKKEYVLNDKGNDFELREVAKIEQYPFRLAYALSIHKSQGLTFDKVSLDLERPCFMPGMLYVALSRVRTPEGLRILTGGRQ